MDYCKVLDNNKRFDSVSDAIKSLKIKEITKIVIYENRKIVDFMKVQRIDDKNCLVFSGPTVLQGIKMSISRVNSEY